MRMTRTFKSALDYTLTLVVGVTLGAGLLIITLNIYGVEWYAP